MVLVLVRQLLRRILLKVIFLNELPLRPVHLDAAQQQEALVGVPLVCDLILSEIQNRSVLSFTLIGRTGLHELRNIRPIYPIVNRVLLHKLLKLQLFILSPIVH